MKIYIEIPEVHKAIVEINVFCGATKEEILAAAQKEFDENGSDVLEYSRTLEHDEWTIRDECGNFFGAVRFGEERDDAADAFVDAIHRDTYEMNKRAKGETT